MATQEPAKLPSRPRRNKASLPLAVVLGGIFWASAAALCRLVSALADPAHRRSFRMVALFGLVGLILAALPG